MLHTLRQSGLHTRVICPLFYRNEALTSSKDPHNIEYIDLRRLRRLGGNSEGIKLLSALIFSFIAFLRIVKKFNSSHCIVQYQTMYSSIPGILAKIFLHTRLVGDDIGLLHTYKRPPNLWILRAADMFILSFTDIILTFSNIDLKFINSKYESKKILMVPNGVTVPKATDVPKRTNKIKVLLFVGTLTFAHNLVAINNIIKMSELLAKKRENFRVLIVGGPIENVSQLMNHVLVRNGSVKFLGYVSDRTLESIYATADIGLLPFFSDTPHSGQRTKALEYFINKTLVISGPEGVQGIHGLKNGEHFLVAETLDEMTAILKDCISNPKKYRNIASNGAKYVQENYSWENLTKDYINYIKKPLVENYCLDK